MAEDKIMDYIAEFLGLFEPFTTAREISEKCKITPQKASGILRKMENRGIIKSKKVKAGMSEVKCYFMEED